MKNSPFFYIAINVQTQEFEQKQTDFNNIQRESADLQHSRGCACLFQTTLNDAIKHRIILTLSVFIDIFGTNNEVFSLCKMFA